MKKNYFSTFFAALMLLVAMPATAQTSSLANLFGKYNFSATMEVTAEGESYRDKFSNDCVVTIEKDDYGYFVGYITGIAGLKGDMAINKITEDLDSITILSPNSYMGEEGLYLSDITGSKNISTGDDTQYGDIVYTYDPTTKTFTLPDFSLVTIKDKQYADKIVAKFTNVKLTFAGDVAVADLSGDWHFTPEEGEYPSTMQGSTLPTEWDMTLNATDEFNKAYDVSFKLGDYNPLALKASFDGRTLAISFNEDYFDAEKKIGLVNMYGELRPGEIKFTLEDENLLKLGNSGITIYDELKEENLQWFLAGVATRSVAEEEAFEWVGTYTITAEVEVEDETYEYPQTGEMEIAYDEEWKEYYVAKLFGKDLYDLWYYGNGIVIVPSAEETNKATIKTISDYGQSVYLQDLGSRVYLKMLDANEGTNPLNLEINEDGTISIDNFKVMIENNASYPATVTPAATYKNVTAVKKSATDGIENTVVENNSVEGIFDLLGRKLDAITVPGLYIVNGKKVLMK